VAIVIEWLNRDFTSVIVGEIEATKKQIYVQAFNRFSAGSVGCSTFWTIPVRRSVFQR